MGQSLREWLDAREREVRRALDDIQKKQIEPLQLELADIIAARQAIKSDKERRQPSLPPEDVDRYRRMKYEDLAILALQSGFPNGATIQEILDHMRSEFGREIAQGSFSPILSRLRQKGILSKDGHAWILNRDV